MTDDRLPWFPCWQSKLLGALAAMPPPQGYVYVIVLLRIYEVGGPCPDTLDALCRRTGYPKRVVSDALDALFRSGKLVREVAGIANAFATDVLADSRSHREGLSAAGQEGARRRWEKTKKKQRSDDSHPNATAKASDAHLQSQESLFPDGNRTPEPAPDERTLLFRTGLETLSRITGKPVDRCRPLIGRWLRDAQDDAVKVRRAIEDAERNRIADPVPWIERAIGSRGAGGAPAGRGRAGSAHLALKRLNQEEEEADGRTDEGRGDGQRSLPARRGS